MKPLRLLVTALLSLAVTAFAFAEDAPKEGTLNSYLNREPGDTAGMRRAGCAGG